MQFSKLYKDRNTTGMFSDRVNQSGVAADLGLDAEEGEVGSRGNGWVGGVSLRSTDRFLK